MQLFKSDNTVTVITLRGLTANLRLLRLGKVSVDLEALALLDMGLD